MLFDFSVINFSLFHLRLITISVKVLREVRVRIKVIIKSDRLMQYQWVIFISDFWICPGMQLFMAWFLLEAQCKTTDDRPAMDWQL